MDRITQITIKNVRAIESLTLDLSRSVTVLIGENGSCKSTVIECLELLRKASDPGFANQLYQLHRGMSGLLRSGAARLELGLRVEDSAQKELPLSYSFTLEPRGAGVVVSQELLDLGPAPGYPEPIRALRRNFGTGTIFEQTTRKLIPFGADGLPADSLAIASFGNLPKQKSIDRALSALRNIEAQLPFDTRATWAARTLQRQDTIRGSTILFPADRLQILGVNLANAWLTLRNGDESHWDYTMELVRLGLGDRVNNVVVTPDLGGGIVYLGLRFKDLPEPVMAGGLSDGQLAWLAWVAMTRLNSGRSLLAVDEPELHLHPALLGRVISLLSNLEGGAPVILTTHSDRVLEMLDDPVDAVRVCSLEGNRAVVSRIDTEEYPRWLEEFGDLGQIRANGFLSRILASPKGIEP